MACTVYWMELERKRKATSCWIDAIVFFFCFFHNWARFWSALVEVNFSYSSKDVSQLSSFIFSYHENYVYSFGVEGVLPVPTLCNWKSIFRQMGDIFWEEIWVMHLHYCTIKWIYSKHYFLSRLPHLRQ